MREIKFRCWYNQTMYEWKNIVSIEGNFLPNPMICLNKVETGRSDQNVLLSEVQLMQYTGLKDKNGTEIYEGDILKNSVEDSTVSVVWDITGGNWQFREHNIFMDDGVGRGDWNLYMGFAKQCEVIGNICENPELLEAKEI